nr:DUF2975 domain-containing protein [uncultured Psychroserpens sp.]
MKTERIFKMMNVVSWIVFIGLCIKAGAIAIVSILSLFANKSATENLYKGIDLSNLYDFSTTHYIYTVLLLILITGLKAYLFYVLIKIFRILDFKNPFSEEVVKLILRISKIALSIGLLGIFANSYMTWLNSKVTFLELDFSTSGYIFMSGVIFIVASLFRQAITIQKENELTI